MSALSYRDGSYFCVACDEKLLIPPGASVRHSFTTVHDGQRDRILLVDGSEVHRCPDRDTAGFTGSPQSTRRR
jgi:hypothetical protein